MPQAKLHLPVKTACKELSALLRSMFLELSSQSASSTVSAARCPACLSRHATSHVLTTSQLQSSRHASCRHHSSCYDQHRRHLARQGPDCNVAITMSASSIAQRQTCCQATASWFVDEYGTSALNGITTMLRHGHSARGTGHILVGEVQCSRESQICALFHSDPLPAF